MKPLRWRCDVCGQLVIGDTGYLGAEHDAIRGTGPILWTVFHDRCHPDENIYSIDLTSMSAPAEIDRWTEHLAEKNWYLRSNWRQAVEARTGYRIPRAVDRHAEPEATAPLTLVLGAGSSPVPSAVSLRHLATQTTTPGSHQ